jgi:chain length determinant protein EpsF
MALLGLLGALAISYGFSPRYRAEATMVIDYKRLDPVSNLLMPSMMMAEDMGTQLEIIKSHRTALRVVRDLQLSSNPEAKRQFMEEAGGVGSMEDWLADLILANLDVKPGKQSTTIDIRYTSPNPNFAAIMANAFARAYTDTNLELRVAPAKETAAWYDQQIRTLRGNVSTAQARLSAYQREKGFSALDERSDVESSKLAELSAQLVSAQAAASDAASRLKQLNDFVSRGADPANLPDILANSLVQSMKAQLAQSEARLEMISSQLGSNHPDVQKLRADIQTQRQKIREEIKNVAAGIANSERIAERRVGEVRQAAGAQKERMLTLSKGRDELAVLIRDAESAQKALDAANSRLTQETLQSQANQTNVIMLSPAIPPLGPRFPRLILNIPLGVVIGLVLGVNLALLREFIDRRINLEEDLLEIANVPVLGWLDGGWRRRTGLIALPRKWRSFRKASSSLAEGTS